MLALLLLRAHALAPRAAPALAARRLLRRRRHLLSPLARSVIAALGQGYARCGVLVSVHYAEKPGPDLVRVRVRARARVGLG